jgi:hypothetical protein
MSKISIFLININILKIIFAAIFLLLASPTVSMVQVMAAEEVDLELLLAVDVSASIDAVEARQQRDGYLAALADPQVIAQIHRGALGRIAVAYMEWAGESYQRKVVDWRVIEDQASAQAFLAHLATAPFVSVPATSISAVIDAARQEFATNLFTGRRRVIDISADGPNSHGRRVSYARDDALAESIVINALVIENTRSNPMGGAPAAGLEGYFRRRVIGGSGAFVMAAHFDNFAPMLLRKLLREIGTDPDLLSQGGVQTLPEGRADRQSAKPSSSALRSPRVAGARAPDARCRARC